MNDLKYAYHKLVNVPGFTAVAVLTLALCLSSNLVIFAVVDSVLLRPLPFREPDRLVTTINAYPKAGVMMIVVLLACWLPARRAARVDPMEALRYE